MLLVQAGSEELTPLRPWLQADISQPAQEIAFLGDFQVPMADGTKLATSIWLPKGAGPFPVILIRTPYGRKRLAAEELRYVRRGYALVAQDVRGREDSEGEWLPMPFESGARLEIENQSDIEIKLYYYVDYEVYDEIDTPLRFHACFRREITVGIDESQVSTAYFHHGGVNLTGENNYVILDAKGKGHYIGCNINIHNLRFTQDWNWYGEGDDMIFIDGEPWPPRLHGTGMEDYFNTAWCPRREYNAPTTGSTWPAATTGAAG